MKAYETIINRRTIRAFKNKNVPYELLEKYANAARLAPMAKNKQPLEFIIIDDDHMTDAIFQKTRLAGGIEWKPGTSEKARAFIAIIANKTLVLPAWISFDAGIAAENICLAAWEDGVGSCMIGAFNKEQVGKLLQVPDSHEILLFVALGYPAHGSIAEDSDEEEMSYSRDNDGAFHVKKRPLKKILHRNKFKKL